MKRADQWRYVRRNAAKNKSRLFLTVLAAAIGCAFLIVLVSVGYGLQESVVAEIAGNAAVNEIEVQARTEDGGYRPITGADIAFFESLPKVRAVTRYLALHQTPMLQWQGEEIGTRMVLSANMEAEVAIGFALAAGRMPEAEDEVIIGYHFGEWLLHSEMADEAGLTKADDLVGTTLDMEVQKFVGESLVSETFTVAIAGVGAPPRQEWRHDDRLLISEAFLAAIEAYTGTESGSLEPVDALGEGPFVPPPPEERVYSGVSVFTQSMEDVQRVADRLDEAGYATYSVVNELGRVNAVFTIMRTGLVLVGAIAILISSIGIYNTMTMAVTERYQEIGIMKALGAHPNDIKSVFLWESAAIGGMGAVIGVIVAWVVGAGVNLLVPWVLQTAFGPTGFENVRFSSIPLGLVLFSAALSIGVALASGVRPAARATEVDVLQALRRDV